MKITTKKTTARSSKRTPAKKAKTTTRRTTTKKTSRPDSATSVNNGIEVLNHAIINELSVSAAAKAKGFGRNYVSDVKSRIESNLRSESITKTQYKTFNSLVKLYSSKKSK